MISAGRRLGPYEIVAPLGAGGMGEVYGGRDTQLRRTRSAALAAEPQAVRPPRHRLCGHQVLLVMDFNP